MPGLPGAATSRDSRGDWAIFHASACSRPPEPTRRMFMAPRLGGPAPPGQAASHRRGAGHAWNPRLGGAVACAGGGLRMAITAEQDPGTAARISALEAELVRARARLGELDHRIKNDLQLIASVFVLQLRKLPDGADRACLRAALDRVSAVAAVHRRLEVGDDPAHFEASGLIRDVAEEAAAAARRDDVRVRFDLTPVTIPSRQAGPLALITGELVRNALKHAFPERPGAIEVVFGPDDGAIQLSVSDDGVGLAGDAPAGFGTTLAALLAQQLRGTFQLSTRDHGARAVLRFPRVD
ncbi:MAG: sensor histidine kinase [Phenylobacterium sp.]|nr:MAG: sensor histidine kinase [Phenylobacterium sp.]